MITTPYDRIADRFHAVRTTFRPKEAEYLALLMDSLPAGSSILDFGCGTGQPIAVHLASLGHRITGVDGSSAMLAIAQKLLPEQRWIHALLETVEFEESFAAVVCWDSLFHLPRRLHEPIIRKLHRWLVPGGRLMISSGGLVEENGSGFTDTMFDHEFFYDSLTPTRMIETIEQAGFEIVISEMSDQPDGGRNKGKWATVARRI